MSHLSCGRRHGDTPPFLAFGWRMTFGSACGGYIDQPRANVGGADSWPKPLAIFGRCNKRFDHFGIDEIAIEDIQLRQPELVTRIVRVGRVVRVASQITEVL